MNDFYQWLYDHYAAPRFDDSVFSPAYQAMKRDWSAFAESLPNRERLLSYDLLNSMKLCWGTQAFAYGLHAGFSLAAGFPAEGWDE